ncbi:2-oxo acid dehydrogenase subunit E2 [Euzebya pacifica]|uniref:2-oxo acid dehydrogenase subunit E2 n=1 Tax=Euzebya pacifica TaxID=1608957 RepID=UPI0030FABDC8
MLNIEMPRLGESVTEATITAWLVEVGDRIEVDQPIAEVSSDKVDTEIPSPVAGTVLAIRVGVNDTVVVGAPILEVRSADGPEPASTQSPAPDHDGVAATEDAPAQDGPRPDRRPVTSPLVRRLLRTAGLDEADVTGTGPNGRITREDVQAATSRGTNGSTPAGPTDNGEVVVQSPPTATAPPIGGGNANERDEVRQELSRIRKVTARTMTRSLQSTAQLTSAVEVDMTAVMAVRAARRTAFRERTGTDLSPLPFIARAVTLVLPRHPSLNASIDLDGGFATLYRRVHLGIAVDTDKGLLVPTVTDAHDLTTAGLATAIGSVASTSRTGGLGPDDLTGGTFTISNTGSRGTLLDTPILNPPQVAILATCAIEKRPVIRTEDGNESIAIRWMSYLCLTYDHRLVDGADAGRFLTDLKQTLASHDFASEIPG